MAEVPSSAPSAKHPSAVAGKTSWRKRHLRSLQRCSMRGQTWPSQVLPLLFLLLGPAWSPVQAQTRARPSCLHAAPQSDPVQSAGAWQSVAQELCKRPLTPCLPAVGTAGTVAAGPTLTLDLGMVITGSSILPFDGAAQFAAASSLAGAFSIILGNGSVQILSSSPVSPRCSYRLHPCS